MSLTFFFGEVYGVRSRLGMVRWINSTDCIYRNGVDKKIRSREYCKWGVTSNVGAVNVARQPKQATYDPHTPHIPPYHTKYTHPPYLKYEKRLRQRLISAVSAFLFIIFGLMLGLGLLLSLLYLLYR